MSKLERNMGTLRRLFEPWNTAPNGTVIWEPDASDPNAQFKCGLIAKAREVLAAGDSALSGTHFSVPEFDGKGFETIQQTLTNDADQQAFIELDSVCGNVVQSLKQLAA